MSLIMLCFGNLQHLFNDIHTSQSTKTIQYYWTGSFGIPYFPAYLKAKFLLMIAIFMTMLYRLRWIRNDLNF